MSDPNVSALPIFRINGSWEAFNWIKVKFTEPPVPGRLVLIMSGGLLSLMSVGLGIMSGTLLPSSGSLPQGSEALAQGSGGLPQWGGTLEIMSGTFPLLSGSLPAPCFVRRQMCWAWCDR